jgi:hypothetical protein
VNAFSVAGSGTKRKAGLTAGPPQKLKKKAAGKKETGPKVKASDKEDQILLNIRSGEWLLVRSQPWTAWPRLQPLSGKLEATTLDSLGYLNSPACSIIASTSPRSYVALAW